MNSLKANCSVMELAGRQLNGLILSFAIDNKELWLMVLKLDWAPVVSGVPQSTVLSPLLFSLQMISPRILNRKSDSLLMIVFVIMKLRMWRIQ